MTPLDLAVALVQSAPEGRKAAREALVLAIVAIPSDPRKPVMVQRPNGTWPAVTQSVERATASAVSGWISAARRRIVRDGGSLAPTASGPKPAGRVEVLVTVTHASAARIAEGGRCVVQVERAK